MYARLLSAIGLAALLILGLCAAPAGQVRPASDYTPATRDALVLRSRHTAELHPIKMLNEPALPSTTLRTGSGVPTASASTAPASLPVLENAYMHLAFDPRTGAVTDVRNRQRDLDLVTRPDVRLPFRLGLDNPDEAAPDAEIVLAEFRTFTWTMTAHQVLNLTWELAYNLTLTATVSLPDDSPNATFSWTLVNRGPMVVNWLAYPYLQGIGPLGDPSTDDRVATMGATSFLQEDPWHRLAPSEERDGKAKGFAGASLLLYYRPGRGGFYAAIQDGEGGRVGLSRQQRDGPLALSYLHRWKADGTAILGALIQGTWYEGADRYRAWAERQPRVARGPLWQRVQNDTAARWLTEDVGFATFGIASSFDQAAWYDAIHDITGQPVFHVLGVDWPRGPVRYGDASTWFPARFDANNLATIRTNGDYFAPFEFDFFFNRFAPGWEAAQPWAAKDWRGEVRFWEKKAHINALMCPATAYWTNFHAWRDATLVHDYGADGNYYDISFPTFCWDAGHEHAPGPGSWLRAAQRRVYTTTQTATTAAAGRYIPQGKEMLEDEHLIDALDFYQARAWAGPVAAWEYDGHCEIEGGCQVIPLLEYIYHEHGPVRLDGWGKLAYDFGDIFYWIAGRVALWGGLFELNYEFSPLEAFAGMEDRDVCHVTYGYTLKCYPPGNPEWRQADPAKMEFLREIAAARTGFARDYLAYGRMMPPPEIVGDVPRVALDWFRYNEPMVHRDNMRGVYTTSSLLQAAYTYRQEKLGFLFVNLLSGQILPITLTLNPADYGLTPEARYQARLVSRQESESRGEFQGPATFSLSLPPRQVVLLEVIPVQPSPMPTPSPSSSPTTTPDSPYQIYLPLVVVGRTRLSSLPSGISVAPLQEFYFPSVISDRPGFGWLADLGG